MTTYSKETALFKNEAIANDIEGASKVATNYFSVNNEGIMVYDGRNGAQTPSSVPSGIKNVFIDSDSMDIRNGTDILASFGEETYIGSEEDSRISLTNDSIIGYGENGKTFFEFSGKGGTGIIPHTHIFFKDKAINFPYSPNATTIFIPETPQTSSSIEISVYCLKPVIDTEHPTYSSKSATFNFTAGTSNSLVDTFKYYGSTSYTINTYYNSNGNYITIYSDSQMNFTGSLVGASITYYTTSSTPTYMFGSRSSGTYGAYSSSFGTNLIPAGSTQTVVGSYNSTENASSKPFIVGNGQGDNSRSNAFEVTWSGDINVSRNAKINGELTAKGHSSPIGTTIYPSSVSDKSVSSDVYTTVISTSEAVPEGVWMIIGCIIFPTTGTTACRKAVRIYNITGSSDVSGSTVIVSTSSGGANRIQTCSFVSISSANGSRMGIQAWHNYSTALSCDGYMRLVRIV